MLAHGSKVRQFRDFDAAAAALPAMQCGDVTFLPWILARFSRATSLAARSSTNAWQANARL